jgi:hypothetical protein
VIQLVHELQQATDFSLGKTLASEPAEVGTGQIGNDVVLVFAVWHDTREQQFEVFRLHDVL